MRRLRPSSPPGERKPERSSSSGVPKAPPASTTARRARTVNGREPSPADGDAGAAFDAGRPGAVEDDPPCLDPGAHAGPGGDRPGQVGDVHRALGVETAADRARAALDAGAGVAAQRRVADAERVGALAQQLAVAAHALRVDRAHVEHLLGLGVVGVQLARPSRSRARATQRSSTGSGVRKQVPGVDHRRPADGAADRGRDRRAALGDGEPAVAVERDQRRERLLRVAGAVDVRAGLEHDHLEPGLGEHGRGDRAAGAGADDDDVAVLLGADRLEVAEGGGVAGAAGGPPAPRRSAPRSRPPPGPGGRCRSRAR